LEWHGNYWHLFNGITLASGSLTLAGADALTITTTGATNSTFPLGTKTLVATDVATLSSLTSIGTIGTGTWQATDVGVAYGGTGVSTLTQYGVLVGNGATDITALTVGTNGQLLVGSTGADPVFATLNADRSLTATTGAGTLEIDVDAVSNFATSLSVASSSPTEELNIVGQMYVGGTSAATSTIQGNTRYCNGDCTQGFM